MSPIPAFIVCLPIAEQIFEELGYKKGDRFPQIVVLAILFFASLSTAATPVAHTVTTMALSLYEGDTGTAINFVSYTIFGVVGCLVTFIAAMLLTRFVMKPDVDRLKNPDSSVLKKEIRPMTRAEGMTLTVFILVVLMWLLPGLIKSVQPCTLMFRMDNAGPEYDALPRQEKTRIAMEGVRAGVLKVNNLLSRDLPNRIRYCNMTRIRLDPLNTADWTRGEMEAREQAKAISDYFIAHVPGFEKSTMVATGTFTGLRDSLRIIGKYVLRDEDVLEGTVFPDAVVKSSYPIDVHEANGIGSIIRKPKTGVFYIPYRCLVTEEAENLLLAGRLISTEYQAHATSCVMMITCMRLGEIAGLAAARSAASGIPANRMDGAALGVELM